jgi:hypothetical protein
MHWTERADPTYTSLACDRGNGMSSFPGDTKEEARFVGEDGVHDAGTCNRTSTTVAITHLLALQQNDPSNWASKPSLA